MLYDLGEYPGLVLDPVGLRYVPGDLLELADPLATFAWLDLYEDADPSRIEASLYVRETAAASVGDGAAPVGAWVYRYVGPLAGARRIASGGWPG